LTNPVVCGDPTKEASETECLSTKNQKNQRNQKNQKKTNQLPQFTHRHPHIFHNKHGMIVLFSFVDHTKQIGTVDGFQKGFLFVSFFQEEKQLMQMFLGFGKFHDMGGVVVFVTPYKKVIPKEQKNVFDDIIRKNTGIFFVEIVAKQRGHI
jgi:hypothetical protein